MSVSGHVRTLDDRVIRRNPPLALPIRKRDPKAGTTIHSEAAVDTLARQRKQLRHVLTAIAEQDLSMKEKVVN